MNDKIQPMSRRAISEYIGKNITERAAWNLTVDMVKIKKREAKLLRRAMRRTPK